MNKTDIKYYVSQIIALPAVGIPTCVAIFFAGGYIGKLTGAHIGVVETGVIFAGVGGPTFRVTSVATGWMLERCGLLLRGAWRFYPDADFLGWLREKDGEV